ncbi:hypothetical protein ACA910_010558 [Epithemia clementina (nom. ined.)]
MLEVTKAPIHIDVIFGMTEGWWRFEDRDLRHNHPTLGAAQWLKILKEEGFVDPKGFSDVLDEQQVGQHIILARTPARDQLPLSFSSARCCIWLDNTGVLASKLIEQLKQREIQFAVSASRAWEEMDESFEHLIFLVGSDERGNDSISPEHIIFSQEQNAMPVMQLAAALDSSAAGEKITLWIVTCGAVSVNDTDTDLCLSQVGLWGVGLVVANERALPGRTKLVYLSRSPTESELSSLAEEIVSGDIECEIAFQDSERYACSIKPQEPVVSLQAMPASGSHYHVHASPTKSLEDLSFRCSREPRLKRGEVEVAVCAASIKF